VARAVRAHAVLTAIGSELRMKSVVDEGVGVRAGDDEDRSARSAVAAAGAAARDEFLAAKRQATVSAVARDDANVDFVDEYLLQGLNGDDADVRAVVFDTLATRALLDGCVVL